MKNVLTKIKNKYSKLPKAIKASLWFLICSFIQKGIQVITTPLYTRLLSTSEYGDYNFFTSWESIISIIITLNLFYGVYSQGLIKFEDDRKRFSSSMQGLTLTLVLIWTIIYLIFKDFINSLIHLDTITMLCMILIVWMSAIFQFWATEEKVDYKYKKIVIITIIFSLLNPILSIVLMKWISNKAFARIVGALITSCLTYSWMLIYQLKKGKQFYLRKYWIYALSFNIPLIPHYLSQTVLNSSDRIMINGMTSTDKVGIYSLAYSLSLLMTMFNTSMMQTISPWLYKKIKKKEINSISRVVYPTIIAVAVVNIILIAFAPEAVKIFAPKTYYDAIWIIPPVAMSVYFTYLYDLFAKFEFYYEKTKLIAGATMVGAILNIVLNYIFIKKYGYIAAGYTTLICYIIYALFHYIAMNKVCDEFLDQIRPYKNKKLIIITVLFMLNGFTFLLLYNNTILRYIYIIIILLLLFIFRKKIFENMKKIIEIKNGG